MEDLAKSPAPSLLDEDPDAEAEAASSKRSDKLKTREDYLLEFERRLLGILKDLEKAIDQKLASAYLLALVVTLVKFNLLMEISVLGIKLDKNTEIVALICCSTFIVLYSLICYQLYKISTVYKYIDENGKSIMAENNDSLPVTIKNMDLFSSGVVGIIASLSIWMWVKVILPKIISNTPFHINIPPIPVMVDPIGGVARLEPQELTLGRNFWLSIVVISTVFLASLLFIPIVVLEFFGWSLIAPLTGATGVLLVSSLIILLIIGVITAVSSFLIFAVCLDNVSSYFKEYLIWLTPTLRAIIEASQYVSVRLPMFR
jgi:hypothetical protein